MTKPTIVLTHRFFPEIIERELKPHAHVIVAPTRAALERAIARADGLITRFSDPVDEKLLARAPRLRVVANYAVGYDNIDCRACARRGVRVTNTPEVLTRATAELAATLLMAAARRVPEGEALCRQGRFKGWDPQMLIGLELRGRHAVLVGPGRIGKETATIFKGLGLKVSWITRKDTDQEILKKLSKAQVLSLHVPLTKETRHWLNAKRIAALPKDAIVINTTRGPVVDERALERALRARKIFAAGLDVYEEEPKIPVGLRRLPNVVLLPHLGSATQEAREGMMRLAIQGCLGVLSGKQPHNELQLSHGH